MSDADERPALGDYPFHRTFPTRWNDDDRFGHVNNTVHYAAMDTTVTAWLLGGEEGYAITADADPAFVVASSCRYFDQASFPDVLVVGLRADRVGRTSVAWGLGLFRQGDGALIATGSFVHVFVDRGTHRPIAVPGPVRDRVERELRASP